jgi:ATP-dependent DNA helicase RecQ
MTKEEKAETMRKWEEKEITTIVATDAFGLGVDLTIRTVVNVGLPFSMDTYWQRSGRAGRDGQPASAMLFWTWKDVSDLNWMTKAPNIDEAKVKANYAEMLK